MVIKQKQSYYKEYYRVLKPSSLLTHDIALKNEQDVQQVAAQMQQVIHVKAQPLPQTQWVNLFKQTGFQNVTSITYQ